MSKLVLLGVLIFLSLGHAQAQTAAEQDRLQRNQIEREQQQREQLQRVPDVRLNLPSVKNESSQLPVETPCFVISSFEIKDLSGKSTSEFEWITNQLAFDRKSPINGQCIGAKGVAWVIDRGQKLLVDAGFVTTRLVAGEQDLSKGHLVLTVVPGRIRSIRLKSEQEAPVNLFNVFPMQTGDLLNLRDIEQALENLKRVPTADADIQIEPSQDEGSQIGDSDLVVTYSQLQLARLTLSVDDSGTKETGKLQGSTTFSLDNAFKLNDLFYFTHTGDLGGGGLSGDRGSQSDTYHYSLPYGYWLLGVTFTNGSYYQSVAGATQNYIYSGKNSNNEIKLSRMLLRDKDEKLSISLAGFQRTTNNLIDGTEVNVQKRIEGGWSGNINYKRFIRDASLEANLTYKKGTGAFGSRPAPEEEFGEGVSRFSLSVFDINASIPFHLFDQSFRSNTVFRIQTNYTALTPLNRFVIGGRHTVRGFDGEFFLSAERGWLLRNELSWLLGDGSHELYAGLDHGEVGGSSSDRLVGTRLTGVAFGIRGRISKLSYDIFMAAPVKKPDAFVTASTISGFSLIASF